MGLFGFFTYEKILICISQITPTYGNINIFIANALQQLNAL